MLKGYAQELTAIHLTTEDDYDLAFCGRRMFVIYVEPATIPLLHPNVCTECLNRAVLSKGPKTCASF